MPQRPVDAFITFLSVSNLERSGRFYGDRLGLELVLDQGPCRIYRVSTSAYLGICTHREDVQAQGVIVTLVTDEVDRWYRELSAAGVEIESAPAHNERFGLYHMFLRDPDGHLVELQEFLDPTWAGVRTADDLLGEARSRIRRWAPGDALREPGALLVDLRDGEDRRREGLIPGAAVIPLSVLEWRADPASPHRLEHVAGHPGPIILVCNDGYSSSLAAARLHELGRANAGDVIGGFRAWKAEGLPVDEAG